MAAAKEMRSAATSALSTAAPASSNTPATKSATPPTPQRPARKPYRLGIATFHSGYPLALTSNGNSGVFSAVLRPNSTEQSARLDGRVQSRLTRYFNTSAFTLPPPFTFGNVSRTLPDVRGPGRRNYDLTLSKMITIKEPFAVMLRAEAFNLTNTPYFGNPGTNLGSANFGVITSSLNERQVQFTAKFLF